MKLQTLLLTRFNIRFLDYATYNLDSQWLTSRFELFEKYCLPSVVEQTSKDFKWVLFFDKDTSMEFKERAENYKKRLENIEICYMSGADSNTGLDRSNGNYRLDYSSEISSLYEDADYTLTIRFDNDDSIESTYLELMQKAAMRSINQPTPPPVVLYSKYGYQMNLGTRSMFKIFYPNNHFIGLLERKDEAMTVFDIAHFDSLQNYNSCCISESKPMWIEIVGNTNAVNVFKLFYRPSPVKSIDEKFGIDVSEYEHYLRNCFFYLYHLTCNFLKNPEKLKEKVLKIFKR